MPQLCLWMPDWGDDWHWEYSKGRRIAIPNTAHWEPPRTPMPAGPGCMSQREAEVGSRIEGPQPGMSAIRRAGFRIRTAGRGCARYYRHRRRTAACLACFKWAPGKWHGDAAWRGVVTGLTALDGGKQTRIGRTSKKRPPVKIASGSVKTGPKSYF